MKYLLLLVILFVSCESSVSNFDSSLLPGFWLGGGVQFDKGVYKPFNQFMEIDSQLEVNVFSGQWQDSLGAIEVKQDSILFPFRKYHRSGVFIKKDELRLGDFYPFTYKKVTPTYLTKDSSEIRKVIKGGQWVCGNEILEFTADSVFVFDRKHKIKERFCWDVYHYNGITFLQKKGSFAKCNYPYNALAIIHSISKDSLEVEMWHTDSFKKLTYIKEEVNTKDFQFPDFQLCDPYLYENNRSDWYYFTYPSFDGGLYRLKKVFDARYKPIKNGRNNGLIKLKFVINCIGDIGHIEVQEMDFDYKKKHLNPLIKNQIIEIFKTAGDWIPAERRNETIDAYKFIVFKIKDGEIDEIFP